MSIANKCVKFHTKGRNRTDNIPKVLEGGGTFLKHPAYLSVCVCLYMSLSVCVCSWHFVLAMRKTKTRPTQSVVVHCEWST